MNRSVSTGDRDDRNANSRRAPGPARSVPRSCRLVSGASDPRGQITAERRVAQPTRAVRARCFRTPLMGFAEVNAHSVPEAAVISRRLAFVRVKPGRVR
jgi:hypothetical protein